MEPTGWLWAQFVGCALLGITTGAIELFSRYQDDPRRLLGMWSTWLYVAGNGCAAVIALEVARANHVHFGGKSQEQIALFQVLISGTTAMLLLRSSAAIVRKDGHDVPAGPAAIMQALLGIAERVIDRNQARRRSEKVREIMPGISFEKAYKPLVTHAIHLLEHPTPEQAERLAQSVAAIGETAGSDQAKAMNLGLLIIKYAGADVLREAVKTLGDDIRAVPDPVNASAPAVSPPVTAKSPSKRATGKATARGRGDKP